MKQHVTVDSEGKTRVLSGVTVGLRKLPLSLPLSEKGDCGTVGNSANSFFGR